MFSSYCLSSIDLIDDGCGTFQPKVRDTVLRQLDLGWVKRTSWASLGRKGTNSFPLFLCGFCFTPIWVPALRPGSCPDANAQCFTITTEMQSSSEHTRQPQRPNPEGSGLLTDTWSSLLKTSCFLEEKQRQMTSSVVTDSSPQVLCSSLEPCLAKSFLNPQANPIIANPPLGPSCWPWLYDFICHFCSAHGNLLLSMINNKILSHSSVIIIFPWCWPLLLGALRTPWKIHLSLLTRFYGTQEERHDVIDNWR